MTSRGTGEQVQSRSRAGLGQPGRAVCWALRVAVSRRSVGKRGAGEVDVVGDAGLEDLVVEVVVVAVQRGPAGADFDTVAEQGEAGRDDAPEGAEVLAGHERRAVRVDVVLRDRQPVRRPAPSAVAPASLTVGSNSWV